MSIFEGRPRGEGRRIAVVAARFNEVITRKLVEGATAGLTSLGVAADAIDVAWVPGAFEIPLVARRLARSGRFDGVICLGAVIRGETAHFDLVANEAARGIADAARDTGVPVIFEVLAVDNLLASGGPHGRRAREQGLGGGGGRALDGVALGRAARGRQRLGGPRGDGRDGVIIDKPWGKVATYALNQPASVRIITVEPEQETSVHYHRMRDEMWVVLDPGLTVEIGNRVVEAQAGEEFMVAAEETHRIRNVGSTRGRVLEIAYGYTTEDDTQRLEDAYGRPLEADW